MRRDAGRPRLLPALCRCRVKIGKIHLSSGFLLLCSWLLYQDRSGIVFLSLLACILHEFGHLCALFCFGSSIKGIHITVSGAKINFTSKLSYTEELITAAAGPAVNLILAFLSINLFKFPVFAGINLALAFFNLLPIGPLDGARILQCLTAQLCSEYLSYRLCRCVTFSFAVIFGIIGTIIALFGKNLTLLLMCIWLLTGTPSKIPAKFDKKEWK